ncbi:hypothetical protein [Blastococcus brunescens]|uniref:hypothetical protein n=1 Tax=Blastococcus brunescens TaxID=1564165 RepID=UPI003BEF2E6A
MPTRPGLLECIERYFAAAPLPDARIHAVGGLDVPVGDPAWPYPARPRADGDPVTAEDVRAAVALQQESGLPTALEWVPECSPGTSAAARAAGLTVEEEPLLVAVDPVELLLPVGLRLYVVGADDPELARYQRVAATAFAHPGGPSDVGDVPLDTSDEARSRTEVLRERIASGRTVMMVAVEKGQPVAVGSHQPVDIDGSEVSEVVGWRRTRGCAGGASVRGWRRRSSRTPPRRRTWCSSPPGTTTWPASTSAWASPGWRPRPSPTSARSPEPTRDRAGSELRGRRRDLRGRRGEPPACRVDVGRPRHFAEQHHHPGADHAHRVQVPVAVDAAHPSLFHRRLRGRGREHAELLVETVRSHGRGGTHPGQDRGRVVGMSHRGEQRQEAGEVPGRRHRLAPLSRDRRGGGRVPGRSYRAATSVTICPPP